MRGVTPDVRAALMTPTPVARFEAEYGPLLCGSRDELLAALRKATGVDATKAYRLGELVRRRGSRSTVQSATETAVAYALHKANPFRSTFARARHARRGDEPSLYTAEDSSSETYSDLFHKARTHKYIRREPDGKGGWRYWYHRPKKPRRGRSFVAEREAKNQAALRLLMEWVPLYGLQGFLGEKVIEPRVEQILAAAAEDESLSAEGRQAARDLSLEGDAWPGASGALRAVDVDGDMTFTQDFEAAVSEHEEVAERVAVLRETAEGRRVVERLAAVFDTSRMWETEHTARKIGEVNPSWEKADVPLMGWCECSSANPYALAFPLVGGSGVFRDPTNQMQEIRPVVGDPHQPLWDTQGNKVHPLLAAEVAGWFLEAQSKLELFPRDQHPTLYRGVKLPRSLVESLTPGVQIPLTGATAFTMREDIATLFAQKTVYAADDADVSVVLRMRRDAEVDASAVAVETGARPDKEQESTQEYALQHGAYEVVSALEDVRVVGLETQDGVVFVDLEPLGDAS